MSDKRLLVTTTQIKDHIVVRITGNEELLRTVSEYLQQVAAGEKNEATISWDGKLTGTSQPMKIIFSLIPRITSSEEVAKPPVPEGGLN